MTLLLIFSDNFAADLHVTHFTVAAAGHAQSGGSATMLRVRYRNTAEYTDRSDVSTGAEYRSFPTGTDRDSSHRR